VAQRECQNFLDFFLSGIYIYNQTGVARDVKIQSQKKVSVFEYLSLSILPEKKTLCAETTWLFVDIVQCREHYNTDKQIH